MYESCFVELRYKVERFEDHSNLGFEKSSGHPYSLDRGVGPVSLFISTLLGRSAISGVVLLGLRGGKSARSICPPSAGQADRAKST